MGTISYEEYAPEQKMILIDTNLNGFDELQELLDDGWTIDKFETASTSDTAYSFVLLHKAT